MQPNLLPPLILVIALLATGACWPLAQKMKHPDQAPLAAFLLFASVLGPVAAAAYFVLTWIVTLLAGTTPGPGTGVVCLVAAALAGGTSARQVIRRPPRRRMPD
ncbi:hypothetical protein A3731_29885 [Roseovarius sp. HI0049]|nr:hypothetical protein A3731_29885 [Roseovarius sp. HI0049]